jgi:hypothetical protein
MRRQGRYIVLLCGNAPSHKHNPVDYPHVRVEFLAANLTAWIQPLDAGIIASFKAQYKRRYIRLALEQDSEGAADIYKIDQLQAMRLAEAAWVSVVVSNCPICSREPRSAPENSSAGSFPPPLQSTPLAHTSTHD